MAEETKKRGRPKKQKPAEALSEEPRRLEMTEKTGGTVAISDVQRGLNELFNQALGASRKMFDVGSLTDFNKYNPFMQNQRLKTVVNTAPGQVDRETLITMLNSPQNSEQSLRAQGWSLSSSQYLYYKLLRMAADVPAFKYYKIPDKAASPEVYSSEAFKSEDAFVDEWLHKFDLVNTFKRMSLEIKREGKPTYVLRNCIIGEGSKRETQYATFQKMPSDYIKLIGIGEHGYIASFNMMVFMNPAVSPSQYPDFIQNIWEDLLSKGYITDNFLSDKHNNASKTRYSADYAKLSTYSYDYVYPNGQHESLNGILEITKDTAKKAYMYWVPMPQDLCYTFCTDSSNAWATPDTAGLFLGLQELTDYDQLAGLLQSTPLTALLTAEMETVPNPNAGADQTIMNPETIAMFQDKFNSSTSQNIEAFFAPLKNFHLQSLPGVPNSSETSTNATKNFIYRTGMGGLLTLTEKPSVSQVKQAQMFMEAECDFVTRQLESALNNVIDKFLGNAFKWRVNIWGNLFTIGDEIKRDKELFFAGGSFVLPKLASAYNISVREARSLQEYVDSLKIYDSMRTVTQVQQMQLAEQKKDTVAEPVVEEKTPGRPALDEGDIENDNTAASKESGLDTSETRSFAQEMFKQHKCIFCQQLSEYAICEECEEKLEEGTLDA